MSVYPNIDKIILNIAACNGVLNRDNPQEVILKQSDKAISKQDKHELSLLEAWLGTLSKRKLSILEDGEEEQMARLVADSPTSMKSGKCVGQIIDEIWEGVA